MNNHMHDKYRTTSRSFQARRHGLCPRCKGYIETGDRIQRLEQSVGCWKAMFQDRSDERKIYLRYVHEHCQERDWDAAPSFYRPRPDFSRITEREQS